MSSVIRNTNDFAEFFVGEPLADLFFAQFADLVQTFAPVDSVNPVSFVKVFQPSPSCVRMPSRISVQLQLVMDVAWRKSNLVVREVLEYNPSYVLRTHRVRILNHVCYFLRCQRIANIPLHAQQYICVCIVMWASFIVPRYIVRTNAHAPGSTRVRKKRKARTPDPAGAGRGASRVMTYAISLLKLQGGTVIVAQRRRERCTVLAWNPGRCERSGLTAANQPRTEQIDPASGGGQRVHV